MLSHEQESWLSAIAPEAVSALDPTPYPTLVAIGHAAIESAWGSKQSGANNIFGVKWYQNAYGRELVTTHEVATQAQMDYEVKAGRIVNPVSVADLGNGLHRWSCQAWFATFSSTAAAFTFYGNLIMNGLFYRKVWGEYMANRDLDAFITGMTAIYSRSGGAEGTLLKQVIAMPQVIKALADARAHLSSTAGPPA